MKHNVKDICQCEICQCKICQCFQISKSNFFNKMHSDTLYSVVFTMSYDITLRGPVW